METEINETKTRKGQIHRTWSRVLIDEVRAKAEKYAAEMKGVDIQRFLESMETVDESVRMKQKDKSYVLMVGRYRKKSKEDFVKMIERQVAAFKESRNQTDELNIDDLLKEI